MNDFQRWFFRMSPAQRYYRAGRTLIVGILIGQYYKRYGLIQKASFCRTWWDACGQLRPERQETVKIQFFS